MFIPFIMGVSMEQTSFKTRVKDAAITNAQAFKENYIDYEYCVCSTSFEEKINIIKTLPGNYLHLVGVNTSMPADTFFKKCINGTLQESDFDFNKRGVASNSLKGAVRDKIRVLPNMVKLINDSEIRVQGNFDRNQISCAFASGDNACTLGFAKSGHPKSLLRGDYLDCEASATPDLILRRKAGATIFDEVILENNPSKYKEELEELISDGIKAKLFQ